MFDLSGYSISAIERPYIIGLPEAKLINDTLNAEAKVTIIEEVGYFGITVELPYGSYASGGLDMPDGNFGGCFIMKNVFVADPRLVGSGTGSRLIAGLIKEAKKKFPEVDIMHTGAARLGCVKAIAKVVGVENLRLLAGNEIEKHYGWNAPHSLEEYFEREPVINPDYKVWATMSNIKEVV